MRRLLPVACFAALVVLRAAGAAADTLTYQSLGQGSWINMNLGTGVESSWAGEINWLLNTSGKSTATAVTTYCADLFDDAKLPTEKVTTTTTAALDASIAAGAGLALHALPNAGAKAAYLVDTYAAAAHASNDLAAGLQIAIWQAMFGASSFTYTASAGIVSAANTFSHNLAVALIANPTSVLSSTAVYFDVSNSVSKFGAKAKGQDQIEPVVGSPEPSTIVLLALAIGALVGYRATARRWASRSILR